MTMPTKNMLFTARSLAYRARPTGLQARIVHQTQTRLASDDASKPATQPKGPNMDQLPHVSEEQAAMDKITGETPPDISQGTPVQEILKRDPEAQKKAPEVMKQQINGTQGSAGNQKRSYTTSARRSAQEQDLVSFTENMAQGLEYPDAGLGHKFPLPQRSNMVRADNFRRRYDEVLDQVTKAIMRDGKLSVAQKNMSIVLDTLRSAPPPQPNPAFPGRALLTSESRQSLPLTPVAYLTTVIDSVAPLIKIRQQRGLAGGGASVPIPIPLGTRQRRRTAIQWILASASNRRETKLAERIAKEIINVAEGKSSVWDRRALVHKLGITARSNVRNALPGRR